MKVSRAIVRKYVKLLGLGVHPDTRGKDYVNADGERVFTDEEAAQYDRDMEYVSSVTDVYALFIEEWEKAGLT